MSNSRRRHITLTHRIGRHIAAVAITLIALTACHDPSPLGRLGGVDSLINARPDSALTLLNSVARDTAEMSRRDLMRFYLLRTSAENKCDTVLTARHAALMRRVCDYYDRHSSPRGGREGAMLAHYLLGRCYSDMGEAPAALEEFHHAAELADTTLSSCDYHLLSLIHSQTSMIYSRMHMPADRLQELQKAAHYALHDSDSLSYWLYTEHSANCYLQLHMPDSFIAIKEKCAEAFSDMGYGNLSAIALGTTAITHLERGDLEKASRYLAEYEKKSGLFMSDGSIEQGRETYYYSKGLYLLQIGETDSAELYFRKELNTGKSHNDQICASQGLCQLYQQLHLSDSVAKYAMYSYAMSDSAYEESVSNSLHRMQAMFDYSRYQEEALKQSREVRKTNDRNAMLCIVIVLISVAFGIIIWVRRNITRQKEKEMNRMLLEYAKDKEALEEKRKELHVLLETEKSISGRLQSVISSKVRQIKEIGDETNQLHKELEDSKHLVQNLQTVIKQKSSQIDDLNKTINEYENLFKSSTFDDSGIVAITKTEVYAAFESYTKQRKNKPSKEQWQQLEDLIELYYPSFKILLKVKNRISRHDYQVCMLDVLGFKPGDIASIMEKELSSVSKTRRKLLKNIFHIVGKPDDFDRILKECI